MDDGAGAHPTQDNSAEISALVRKDIVLGWFVPSEEKSQWVPPQIGELLSFTMDLRHRNFQVLERRVQALKQLIGTIIKKGFTVSARCLSRLTGSLVSMGLTLGPVVRLWTRSLYADMCCASS